MLIFLLHESPFFYLYSIFYLTLYCFIKFYKILHWVGFASHLKKHFNDTEYRIHIWLPLSYHSFRILCGVAGTTLLGCSESEGSEGCPRLPWLSQFGWNSSVSGWRCAFLCSVTAHSYASCWRVMDNAAYRDANSCPGVEIVCGRDEEQAAGVGIISAQPHRTWHPGAGCLPRGPLLSALGGNLQPPSVLCPTPVVGEEALCEGCHLPSFPSCPLPNSLP